MVNNLIDREEDFINKISGSQLIAGNIVYYDEENAFDTKKEERIEITRTRARAIKEKIAQFTDNELRYAYKMVQTEKERLIRAWPALFDNDYVFNNVFIYIDIDAFYASVEMIVNPVSGPLAVGSMSMLAAVNYDARKYGIRSGMPGYQGRTLCPSLVIRKCNFELYNIFSERVMGMLAKFDENIEIYGLDECSLVMDEEKMRKGYKYFCEWDGGCECLLNDSSDDFSCNTRTTNSFESHRNSTENGEKPIDLQERDTKKMQVKPNETYNDGKKYIDLVSTTATKIEEDVIATKTENEIMNPQNEFLFDTCSQTTKCTREELFSLGNENKIFIKDYSVEYKSYGVKRSPLDRKSALPKINESPSSLHDISVTTDVMNHLTYENSSHFQICAEHKKKIQTLPLTFANVERLVNAIRAHIKKYIGLTVSAGISVCRGLSKLCSTMNKPNGQFTLSSRTEKFLNPMKITKITGIGPKMSILLENSMEITTIEQLHAHMHVIYLVMKKKSFHNLFRMSYGLSHFDGASSECTRSYKQPSFKDMVRSSRMPSNLSIGKSRTFNQTNDYKMLMDVLWSLCKSLGRRLKDGQAAIATITVKTENYKTIVKRQRGILRNDIQILDTCSVLLKEAVSTLCIQESDNITPCYGCTSKENHEKAFKHNVKIRLLGVSLSKFSKKSSFFRRRKMSTDIKRCIECQRVFINVSDTFFYSHVNMCLDWKEQKNKKNLLRYFNVIKRS